MRTVIVSDMHLTDGERVDPKHPYWKAWKRARFFIDDDFARLLDHVHQTSDEPVELILNGDIFDFDAITALPEGETPGPVIWLARLRGLGSERWMSVFKMERIIADHPVWFRALSQFVRRGHRAVFVTGNHDLELHWPRVQEQVVGALDLDEAARARVVFCSWFYLSGDDTYVSHGHQYDPYCTVSKPMHPLVGSANRPRVRIPFGNMAQRYMLNGMGYFNPHAVSNYIMTARQYAAFFFKYMLRTQPFLLLTWFWSAVVTLWLSLWEFWRPPMVDPLLVDEKVAREAARASATPAMVRKLNAMHVPSACTNPFMITRELWLDRGFLFLLIVYFAFQLIAGINFLWPISPWWLLLPFGLLFPVFLLYSFHVSAQVFAEDLLSPERAELICRITGAQTAVFGHTHHPEIRDVGAMTYVNGGFWSPAFAEPECIHRIGTQTYVEIAPDGADEGSERRPRLFEWPPGGTAPRKFEGATEKTKQD